MRLLANCLLAVSALALAAAGCASDPAKGYTTESLYPQNVSTVAVPIWSRGASIYRRDIEQDLTEAIVKTIELQTPYKVTSESRADTILTGSLDTVGQRVLTLNPDTGQPRELEVTFTVSFVWRDLRTGKILLERKDLAVAATYIPESPFNEDFFIGQEDLVNRVAQRVVEALETPW